MGGQFCPICLPSNAFVSGQRGTFNLKMLSISDCSLCREKAALAMTTVPYEVGPTGRGTVNLFGKYFDLRSVDVNRLWL